MDRRIEGEFSNHAHRAEPGNVGQPDLLPFGLMGKKLTEIIETFPSCYQILPLYACGIDQNGRPINFFEDESWGKPVYRHLFHRAREFRRELGMTSVFLLYPSSAMG